MSAASRILIEIGRQTLSLFGADGACIRRYRVSTARNGAGEREGSGCTPRGRHRVRAKIGAGAPVGTVEIRKETVLMVKPALPPPAAEPPTSPASR